MTPETISLSFCPTMATIDPSDGSEDVTDFLRRIRELGDQRDREDAERTRKLEEEIMEGRRQREARRVGEAKAAREPVSFHACHGPTNQFYFS